MAGTMSRVRMSDIKKRVTMNEIVFTAIMMIKTRAMRKRPRSTVGNSVEQLITFHYSILNLNYVVTRIGTISPDLR
jgi:hypothetical protein